MGQIIWYEDLEKGVWKKIIDSKLYEIFSCLKKIANDEELNFINLSEGKQTKYIKYLFSMFALKKPYRRVYSNKIFHIEDGSSEKIYDESILDKLPRLIGIQENGFELFKKEFREKIKSTEWLYDIHWYLEVDDNENEELEPSRNKPLNKQYCPVRFPLALESEWRQPNDVKYDFQKLLFCNAENKLMIFKTKEIDKDILAKSEMSSYFVNAIEYFPTGQLQIEAKYCFVAFSSKSKKIFFGTYIEQN